MHRWWSYKVVEYFLGPNACKIATLWFTKFFFLVFDGTTAIPPTFQTISISVMIASVMHFAGEQLDKQRSSGL
jgi:hypothetical protein